MVAPVPFTPWTMTVARSGRTTTPIAAAQAPIPSPQPFASANTYHGLRLNDASSDDKLTDWSEVLLTQHTPHDTDTSISSGNDKATTVEADTEPSSPPTVHTLGSTHASARLLQLLETKVTNLLGTKVTVMETKWTDISQRLVDERRAQNAKDDDERRARNATEESNLAQILASAKTMVESVVHPIRADVNALKGTVDPLRADVDALKGTVDGINDTISPLWDELWINVTEIKDTVDAMECRVLGIVNSSYCHITRMTIPLLTACLDVLEVRPPDEVPAPPPRRE